MKREKVLTYAGATAAMIFWGVSFVWTKVVFKYYGPFTTVFIRLILSTLMMTPFIFLEKKNQRSIQRSDIPAFLLLAFFEPFCYFIGEHLGMVEVSSTLASIIIALIPVVTPVFTYFLLRERLSLLNLSGLIISFSGVALFITGDGTDFRASIKGILLLVFAVFAGVAYGIAAKRMSHKYSPMTIVRTQNLIGAFYFLPLFLSFEAKDFIGVSPNFELISTLLMLSLFGSTLAFIFMTRALRVLGVTRTNIFTNTIPLFTAFFAFLILGERITPLKVIAIIVVVGGIFMSQVDRKKAVLHED